MLLLLMDPELRHLAKERIPAEEDHPKSEEAPESEEHPEEIEEVLEGEGVNLNQAVQIFSQIVIQTILNSAHICVLCKANIHQFNDRLIKLICDSVVLCE